jgi:2,4-dienoyl-CoA reductase-like NADH-dependent reductase (Old Yellow Enzyme family)/thioredoxin reductase
MSADAYPHLFSEWQLRNTTIPNRIAFAPTCPTWVDDPYAGVFGDQAVAYYEERAKAGLGLIITGANMIQQSALYGTVAFPGLWNDEQVEGLRRVVDAVHAHGTRFCVQLLHAGLRAEATLNKDSAYDLDAPWYALAPSQVPPGEFPWAPMPKELEEHEIEEILEAFASAAGRAAAAGVDGIEFHLAHGYLPWQFLSPLYNHRSDRWGGSEENRLRFSVEALRRMREAIGDDVFMGYRINSTSFWPGDLETEDVERVIAALERETDIDYVSVSAGVHHSFIHTPMTYEGGWERPYTVSAKRVSSKPVLLVGRITLPDVAESILEAGEADAILLARQLFADPEWPQKVREGRLKDIRRCVAANYCWRQVVSSRRVQCVYNPTVGRERQWGAGTVTQAAQQRRVVVVGAGPAGLEYARIAAARGHVVTVVDRAAQAGGHTRALAALPGRSEYGRIGTWLAEQAEGNGATLRLGEEATLDGGVLAQDDHDHVVIATGARYRPDGWQGQTASSLAGWETGNCVAWDDVANGDVTPTGRVLVVDDLQDVAGPLTAVLLKERGCDVTVVTRWPMVGMETIPEVYYLWLRQQLFAADVPVMPDHFVASIDGTKVDLINVYVPERTTTVQADWLVMNTGRQSENALYHGLRERGASVEMIGDAVAPRATYDAVFEGHRAARAL